MRIRSWPGLGVGGRVQWALLEGLSDEVARHVLAVCRRRRYARNEILFHEGDPADTLHLISKGRVAIRITTPLGDIATLDILGTGDLIGEITILSPDGRRSATALALEPTETLSLRKETFDGLSSEHPSITQELTKVLAERVRRLSNQLIEARYVPVDTRVRRLLVTLAETYREEEGVAILLTQEDVAGLAGTTRPTVNRILREEEQRGSIRLSRGRIILLNVDALTRRAR